jgi:enoyl-CoA hydratase
MPDYNSIIVDRRGQADWVTLNRPDKLNAINREMDQELKSYFASIENDDDVRVIILRGAGRGFCAGLDLQGPREDFSDSAAVLRSQRVSSQLIAKMSRVPQPIVSLVHGAACGLGFALALVSDIRLGGESAKMNAAFVHIGVSGCDAGVSYFLPRMCGMSVAAELLYTGDYLRAERALQLGVFSRVVPDAELEAAAEPLIRSMLATAPLALRMTKDCLRANINVSSIEDALAMEDRNQAVCVMSHDFAERMKSFQTRKLGNRD